MHLRNALPTNALRATRCAAKCFSVPSGGSLWIEFSARRERFGSPADLAKVLERCVMRADLATVFSDTVQRAGSFAARALHRSCGRSGCACRRATWERTRCGHSKHRGTTRRRTRGNGAGGVNAVHGHIVQTAKRGGVERTHRVLVRVNGGSAGEWGTGSNKHARRGEGLPVGRWTGNRVAASRPAGSGAGRGRWLL